MKDEFEARGAAILGISFDDRSANARFAENERFNFPLLCDTSRSVGLAYGACDNPTASTARRISYLVGADGKILRAYPKVDPATHPAEVLADLQSAPR